MEITLKASSLNHTGACDMQGLGSAPSMLWNDVPQELSEQVCEMVLAMYCSDLFWTKNRSKNHGVPTSCSFHSVLSWNFLFETPILPTSNWVSRFLIFWPCYIHLKRSWRSPPKGSSFETAYDQALEVTTGTTNGKGSMNDLSEWSKWIIWFDLTSSDLISFDITINSR